MQIFVLQEIKVGKKRIGSANIRACHDAKSLPLRYLSHSVLVNLWWQEKQFNPDVEGSRFYGVEEHVWRSVESLLLPSEEYCLAIVHLLVAWW